MSDRASMSGTIDSTEDWAAANLQYLHAEIQRLRLLLRLRAGKLRKQWQNELSQVPSGFQSLVISDAEANAFLEENAEDEASFSSTHEEQEILDLLSEQQQSLNEARELCAGTPPALSILAHLFHLGRLEQDVLLLCLAPELDSRFERLYAYLQDDVARNYPSAALAQDVLMTGSGAYGALDIRLVLSPQSPLRRYGLLHADATVASNWRHEPLRLDRRVGDYLLGINRPDEHLQAWTHPMTGSSPMDPQSEELVEQLNQRLRGWSDANQHPLVEIVGPPETSPQRVARELCSRLGFNLYALDLAQLALAAGERQAACRLLERESLLLSCGYFIDASQIDRNDAVQMNSLRELVHDLRALSIVATREPLHLERSPIVARLPRLGAQVKGEMWRNALQDADASDEFAARAVGQFNFDSHQVKSVVNAAREAAMLRGRESASPTASDLWRAAREHASRSMQGLADKIEPGRCFDDLMLPPAQMQQLREIALQVEHRTQVYEGWGFGAKMSRGKGISALFSGPSGTGKTMAAEVLARHLDLDLYRIDLAGVVSKYIGETEKNLRRLFDAAEESGAILFFDEADALFGKRSEVRDSHDRYANIEINYLLQRMEEYRGLAILATNRKSLLDPAFLRRLRFLVEFPFPAATERARIWRSIFPAQARVNGLDYDFLGRLEIAGGNISNIALNAAFRASAENSPVNMNHVLAAARQEYDKIDKMVLESEFGRYYAAVRR